MRADGRFFGTLCAIDPLPARLDDPHVLQTLELFAQLIASQLDADDRMLRTDAELSASHDLAKLREQFIAVLGHDLQNPLQAISMAAEMLLLDPLPSAARRNVQRIQGSVDRMSDLVHDVLDFARGRLGGGIPVALHAHADLAADLQQVVTEHNGGPPIAADKLGRLFQPFSRTLADEPGPGLGLGLFIAAEIAKAHLGTLSVASTEAEGTRFTFRMPVA